MTEKEQIEEMEKTIDEMYNVYITIANIAEGLHNAGYRKIDDDCAVITKDELKQYKVQAVREFAEKLKETAFRMSPNSNEKFIYAQNVDVILDKLLKEYKEWRISD